VAEQGAQDPERVAGDLALAARWIDHEQSIALQAGGADAGSVLSGNRLVGRETIIGDVVHYTFEVRVGAGAYDKISLHRVVREPIPYRPIRTAHNVLFLHGDAKDFEGVYLPGLKSPRQPDDFGIAVYLAQNDVDVWGLDQGWCLVPEGESNLGFMADWGMQRQVNDLSTGLTIARVLRGISGSGGGKMILGGFSSGAATGFALLNQEAALPPLLRNAAAFIPIDYGLKTDDPTWAGFSCAQAERLQGLIEQGQYASFNPFVVFGRPALMDPDGPSPYIPGLTNLQAAIAVGASPSAPGITYHLVAGSFESGLPVGLQYTPVDVWVDFMNYAPPWEPNAFMRDVYRSACGQEDVPWDDRLHRIRVPVLFVKPAGGAGYLGEHTLDLIGSQDITRLEISLHPPEEVLLDFAHVDLFTATDAPVLVWQPILNWINGHTDAVPVEEDAAELLP